MAESAVRWGENREVALELRAIVPRTMHSSCERLGHGSGICCHLSGDALVYQCSFPPTTREKKMAKCY